MSDSDHRCDYDCTCNCGKCGDCYCRTCSCKWSDCSCRYEWGQDEYNLNCLLCWCFCCMGILNPNPMTTCSDVITPVPKHAPAASPPGVMQQPLVQEPPGDQYKGQFGTEFAPSTPAGKAAQGQEA